MPQKPPRALLWFGEVGVDTAETALRDNAVFLLLGKMQQNFSLRQGYLDVAGHAVDVHFPKGMGGDDTGACRRFDPVFEVEVRVSRQRIREPKRPVAGEGRGDNQLIAMALRGDIYLVQFKRA